MSFLGFDSHGKSGEDDSQPPEPHPRGEAALSGETEACLEGRIVEHLAAAGRTVPTWAGLSELAHASPEGLADLAERNGRPGNAPEPGESARQAAQRSLASGLRPAARHLTRSRGSNKRSSSPGSCGSSNDPRSRR